MTRPATLLVVLSWGALTLTGAGCWVVNSSFGDAGEASAGATGTTSGASVGTSAGSTSGASGGTVASESSGGSGSGSATTGTSGASGASGTSTDGTSGTSTDGTSTGGTSTGGTTGGLCPALAEYDNLYANDPECRACMEVQCCGKLGACAGACATAANCVANDYCIGDWFQCPGYSTYEGMLIDTLMCIQGACLSECNIGPCATQLANCSADPACLATYQCTLGCPGMSGGNLTDLFECASDCNESHGGGSLWDAVAQCFLTQCF